MPVVYLLQDDSNAFDNAKKSHNVLVNPNRSEHPELSSELLHNIIE